MHLSITLRVDNTKHYLVWSVIPTFVCNGQILHKDIGLVIFLITMIQKLMVMMILIVYGDLMIKCFSSARHSKNR